MWGSRKTSWDGPAKKNILSKMEIFIERNTWKSTLHCQRYKITVCPDDLEEMLRFTKYFFLQQTITNYLYVYNFLVDFWKILYYYYVEFNSIQKFSANNSINNDLLWNFSYTHFFPWKFPSIVGRILRGENHDLIQYLLNSSDRKLKSYKFSPFKVDIY